MAIVTVEYYGIEGQGRTVTEAKRDAGSRIERMLAGSYTPRLYAAHSPDGEVHQALIWREPAGGWQYAMLHTPTSPRGDVLYGCSGWEIDMDTCLASCLQHLAQVAWSHDVANDEWFISSIIDGVLSATEAKRVRSELASWCAWQRQYHELRTMGHGDDCARLICGNVPSHCDCFDVASMPMEQAHV